PVAQAHRVGRVGPGEQAVDLAGFEDHRQPLGPVGNSQAPRRGWWVAGPGSRGSTWPGLRTTGNRLGPWGTPRLAAGLSGIRPRRARNRNAVRRAAAFLAIDAAASPRVRCKARNLRSSSGSTRAGSVTPALPAT